MSVDRTTKAWQVAYDIAKKNEYAGYEWGGKLDVHGKQPVMKRADNLVRCGYIHDGDPYGWCQNAEVTILCEAKGGKNDCGGPADYYGETGSYNGVFDDGTGWYTEWVNAAVLVAVKG